MNASTRPPRGTEPPDRDPELDDRLARYLRDAPDRAPAHLLGSTAVRVHATPQRRRGWRLGTSISEWALVAAVAAVAVIASLGLRIQPDTGVPGSPRPTPVVASIGPGREPIVVQQIATPTIVRDVFVVDGTAWAVLVDGLVFEIDTATGEVLTQLDAQLDEPTDAASGAGALWFGSGDGDLVKVDVARRSIGATIDVGIAHHAVAASGEAVWIAGTSEARRIDAATLAVTDFDLPPGVVELAAVRDEVWATYASGEIVIVDGRTGAARTTLQTALGVAEEPGGIFVARTDEAWVANALAGGPLHRIDAARHEIVGSVRFESPGRPAAVAQDDAGAWVLLGDVGVVVRVERDGLRVVDTINVGLGARGIGLLPNGLALWGAGGIRVLDVQLGT